MCTNVENASHDRAPIVQRPTIGEEVGEKCQVFHDGEYQHAGRNPERLHYQTKSLNHIAVATVRIQPQALGFNQVFDLKRFSRPGAAHQLRGDQVRQQFTACFVVKIVRYGYLSNSMRIGSTGDS